METLYHSTFTAKDDVIETLRLKDGYGGRDYLLKNNTLTITSPGHTFVYQFESDALMTLSDIAALEPEELAEHHVYGDLLTWSNQKAGAFIEQHCVDPVEFHMLGCDAFTAHGDTWYQWLRHPRTMGSEKNNAEVYFPEVPFNKLTAIGRVHHWGHLYNVKALRDGLRE